MKIVVVIVTYNPGKWLDKCFSSLRTSTIPINTIVIDNCSKDGSQDIIKINYPEVDLIVSNENFGFGKANNIGIKKAFDNGADFVLLLNQDTWIESNTIEKLVEYHQKSADFDIISPMHLDGSGNNLDYNFSTYINSTDCKNLISDMYLNQIKSKLYEVKFVNAAAWLLTRKCIETVGGFNPLFYHYGEDNNYIDRLHFHGLKIGICPIAKIGHDREQINKSIFFEKGELSKRGKLLKYLNPSNPNYIDSEISILTRNTLYFIATLRLKKAVDSFREKNKLKRFSVQVKDNIQLCSRKEPTFL